MYCTTYIIKASFNEKNILSLVNKSLKRFLDFWSRIMNELSTSIFIMCCDRELVKLLKYTNIIHFLIVLITREPLFSWCGLYRSLQQKKDLIHRLGIVINSLARFLWCSVLALYISFLEKIVVPYNMSCTVQKCQDILGSHINLNNLVLHCILGKLWKVHNA